MKKITLLIFLIVLIPIFVHAQTLNCQYKVNESYTESVEVFYQNGKSIGENLNISSLVTVEISGFTIKATNNLKVPVTLEIEYQRYSSWFGVDERRTVTMDLDKQSSDIIKDEFSGTAFPASISLINYRFIKPNLITSETKIVQKIRPVCKLCSGQVCFDDNTICNPLYDDLKCGSGTCNIAGFCGQQKIVSCPNGLQNCNDKQCLKPSTKNIGEAYSCSFECISDRYENGICLESSKQVALAKNAKIGIWIFASIIFLIILSAGIWYFSIHKRKKEEEAAKKAKNDKIKIESEVQQLKQTKEELRQKVIEFNNEIKSLQGEESIILEQIKRLKEKKENAHGEAKKKIEDALKRQEKEYANKQEEIVKHYESQKKLYDSKLKDITASIAELKKQRTELNEELQKQESKWKEKIKNASEEAKAKFEQDYEKIKKQNSEKMKRLDREKEELKSYEKELLAKQNMIIDKQNELNSQEKNIDAQSEQNKIKIALQKYNPQAKNNLKYDEQTSYLVFKDSGMPFHIWKYKNYLKNEGKIPPFEYEVHHINRNKLDNELKNLIHLRKEQHNYKKFNHDLIEYNNWESGIAQLKLQLKMKDKDFPKHIRRCLKRNNVNQRTL